MRPTVITLVLVGLLAMAYCAYAAGANQSDASSVPAPLPPPPPPPAANPNNVGDLFPQIAPQPEHPVRPSPAANAPAGATTPPTPVAAVSAGLLPPPPAPPSDLTIPASANGNLQPVAPLAGAPGTAAEAGPGVASTLALPKSATAAPAALGRKVNLLKLIDPRHGVVKGHWGLGDGVLESDTTVYARLEFSYEPPEEYDYRVLFSRETGDDCLTMMLLIDGHQTCWLLGANSDTMCRFETAPRVLGVGPSLVGSPCLVQHGRYECLVQVRKNSLTILVNGKIIAADKPTADNRTPWNKYTMSGVWRLPDAGVLGLGTWKSKFKIYAAEVQEISGPGKQTR